MLFSLNLFSPRPNRPSQPQRHSVHPRRSQPSQDGYDSSSSTDSARTARSSSMLNPNHHGTPRNHSTHHHNHTQRAHSHQHLNSTSHHNQTYNPHHRPVLRSVSASASATSLTPEFSAPVAHRSRPVSPFQPASPSYPYPPPHPSPSPHLLHPDSYTRGPEHNNRNSRVDSFQQFFLTPSSAPSSAYTSDADSEPTSPLLPRHRRSRRPYEDDDQVYDDPDGSSISLHDRRSVSGGNNISKWWNFRGGFSRRSPPHSNSALDINDSGGHSGWGNEDIGPAARFFSRRSSSGGSMGGSTSSGYSMLSISMTGRRRRRRGRGDGWCCFTFRSVKRILRIIIRHPLFPTQPTSILLTLFLLTILAIFITLLLMHLLNPDKEPLPWRAYCAVPDTSSTPPSLYPPYALAPDASSPQFLDSFNFDLDSEDDSVDSDTSPNPRLSSHLSDSYKSISQYLLHPTTSSVFPPPPHILDAIPPAGIFLGIFSMDSSEQRRMLVRSTWASHVRSRNGAGVRVGKDGMVYGDDGAGTSRTVVKFILGKPRSTWERRIQLEAETYNDMIILPIGENMNYGKTHAFFTWASTGAWVPPYIPPSNDSAYPTSESSPENDDRPRLTPIPAAKLSYSNITAPAPLKLALHDPVPVFPHLPEDFPDSDLPDSKDGDEDEERDEEDGLEDEEGEAEPEKRANGQIPVIDSAPLPWVRPDFVIKVDDDSFVMLAELEAKLRVELYTSYLMKGAPGSAKRKVMTKRKREVNLENDLQHLELLPEPGTLEPGDLEIRERPSEGVHALEERAPFSQTGVQAPASSVGPEPSDSVEEDLSSTAHSTSTTPTKPKTTPTPGKPHEKGDTDLDDNDGDFDHPSPLDDPLIYWGYLVKNQFMAGELYALSWSLVSWVARDPALRGMTKGKEDKQVAKWMGMHPRAREVRWRSERCWIYDHPRAGTVYSHGFLFPSEATRVKKELTASLKAAADQDALGSQPQVGAQAKLNGSNNGNNPSHLANKLDSSASLVSSPVLSWAHSTVSTFGSSYKEPASDLTTLQSVEALIEGSLLSQIRVINEAREKEKEKEKDKDSNSNPVPSSGSNQNSVSLLTLEEAYHHREGRLTRYEGRRVGGTVVVHFIKKNPWFLEVALALLEGDEVTNAEMEEARKKMLAEDGGDISRFIRLNGLNVHRVASWLGKKIGRSR